MFSNLNLPNKLTLSRMFLAPVYLLFMLWEFDYHFLVAAAIFGAASLTDFFDGRLARKYNQITVFGKLCDPIGDKMLTAAALLAFMKFGYCSIWVVMIVLSREFVIASLRMILLSQDIVLPAGILGKIKTASQMVFTVIVMFLMHFQPENGVLASNIMMWITAVLTAVSGIKYLADSAKQIDFTK